MLCPKCKNPSRPDSFFCDEHSPGTTAEAAQLCLRLIHDIQQRLPECPEAGASKQGKSLAATLDAASESISSLLQGR